MVGTELIDPKLELPVVLKLKQGDRNALATIYKWYGDSLYRQVILTRLPTVELAEDVLKDTFRLAIERIHQYEPRGTSIFFWLRRIAINRTIDVHRANQRKKIFEESIRQHPDLIVSKPKLPDTGQEIEETKTLVNEALSKLNPRYSQVLTLRFIEDKDRDECAEILGVTLGNFDVLFHRACKAFRKVYP